MASIDPTIDPTEERDELALAYCDDAHDGPGWYLWHVEYPDEGSIGAFKTREAAVAWVNENSDSCYLSERSEGR